MFQMSTLCVRAMGTFSPSHLKERLHCCCMTDPPVLKATERYRILSKNFLNVKHVNIWHYTLAWF